MTTKFMGFQIPSWAVAGIVAIALTIGGGLVKWGEARQRMDSLDAQLSSLMVKQDKDMSEMRQKMDKIYDLLLSMNK